MFVMFMVGVSLYSSTVLIPQFLQEIMGYSAEQAGMAVSSGGLALMFLFPVAGALAPKFDPRKLVAMGFTITTFGLYRMTGINLNVSFGMAVSWRVVIALGLPFLFIPHQHALLRGHSAGEVQRGQRHVRADAQPRRQRGHQLCDHAAGAPDAEAPGHAQRAHRQRQRAVRHALRNGLAGAWMKRGVGAMPDAMQQAGAQIYGMAQIPGPPAGLCRRHLDHGRADGDPDPAALPDEALNRVLTRTTEIVKDAYPPP
jgi:MFS transporter, DHA2 family, multidrug resistance protein